MKSYQVLKPLIVRMGLQARVAETGSVRRGWIRVCDKISAELRRPLDDPDSFRFSDVEFEGEKPLDLRLRFFDPERFEIRENKKKFLGRVGEKIKAANLCFTIAHVPNHLKTGC